jgi:hypothetical protein
MKPNTVGVPATRLVVAVEITIFRTTWFFRSVRKTFAVSISVMKAGRLNFAVVPLASLYPAAPDPARFVKLPAADTCSTSCPWYEFTYTTPLTLTAVP